MTDLPLCLRALTVGDGFPQADFDGCVHSLFRRACNVRLDDGRLITFLTAGAHDQPQGARLDTSPGFAFDALPLARKAPVAGRAGQVRFDGAGLRVDLQTAQVWRCNLSELSVDLSQPDARRAWSAAREELVRRTSADWQSSAWIEKARPAIHALSRASRCLDRAGARAAVADLVGLGPGLTPSADDFLVGYLTGLWSATGDNAARHVFVAALGDDLMALADRTNDISRAYLRLAARGQVSRLLFNLAAAIGRGYTDGEARGLARIALDVGHSSGADGVAGLLVALSVWNEPGETRKAGAPTIGLGKPTPAH